VRPIGFRRSTRSMKNESFDVPCSRRR
jgi:hypothetical protein